MRWGKDGGRGQGRPSTEPAGRRGRPRGGSLPGTESGPSMFPRQAQPGNGLCPGRARRWRCGSQGQSGTHGTAGAGPWAQLSPRCSLGNGVPGPGRGVARPGNPECSGRGWGPPSWCWGPAAAVGPPARRTPATQPGHLRVTGPGRRVGAALVPSARAASFLRRAGSTPGRGRARPAAPSASASASAALLLLAKPSRAPVWLARLAFRPPCDNSGSRCECSSA